MSTENIRELLGTYSGTSWGQACINVVQENSHLELGRIMKPVFEKIVSAFIVKDHQNDLYDRHAEMSNLPKKSASDTHTWFSPKKKGVATAATTSKNTSEDVVVNFANTSCIQPYGSFTISIRSDGCLKFEPTKMSNRNQLVCTSPIKKLYKFKMPPKARGAPGDTIVCCELVFPVQYRTSKLQYVLARWKHDQIFTDDNMECSESFVMELQEVYGGALEVETPCFDGIACLQGARDGVLFVLNSGLFHLTKPLIHIKGDTIKSYELCGRSSDRCDVVVEYNNGGEKSATFEMMSLENGELLKQECKAFVNGQRRNRGGGDDHDDSDDSDSSFHMGDDSSDDEDNDSSDDSDISDDAKQTLRTNDRQKPTNVEKNDDAGDEKVDDSDEYDDDDDDEISDDYPSVASGDMYVLHTNEEGEDDGEPLPKRRRKNTHTSQSQEEQPPHEKGASSFTHHMSNPTVLPNDDPATTSTVVGPTAGPSIDVSVITTPAKGVPVVIDPIEHPKAVVDTENNNNIIVLD